MKTNNKQKEEEEGEEKT